MAEDILDNMQSDPRFQSDLQIIKLIKNDILSASLKHEMEVSNNTLNGHLYDFDLNSIIFEEMEFNEKDVEQDILLWYYFQVRKVVDEIHGKGDRMNLDLVHDRATALYYELKKYKTNE